MHNLHIHTLLDTISDTTIESYIARCVSSMKQNEEIGYAGFNSKENLTHQLSRNILDSKKIQVSGHSKEKIDTIIKTAFSKAEKIIGAKKDIHVFVFTSFNQRFKEKEFGGVGGFTPWKGTIHLYIDSETFNESSLEETFLHELTHALYFYQKLAHTILDQMIFEGLAENFTEQITNKRGAWTKVFDMSEVRSIVNSLNPILKETNYELSDQIFFGSEKYKRWTGYSVGYWLVRNYIETEKISDWDRLLKTESVIFLKTLN